MRKQVNISLLFFLLFVQINENIYADNIDDKENVSDNEATVVSTDSFEEFSQAAVEMMDEYDLIADESEEYATGRLVVKTDEAEFDTLDAVSVVEGYDGYSILQFESVESTETAFEYYIDQDYVESVDPDVIMETCDSYKSWGYNAYNSSNSSSINLSSFVDAYSSKFSNEEVVVAVIDTGVERNHEMFMDDNNQSRVLSTGFDVVGKDGTSNSNLYSFETTDVIDDNGHGTHVAGTIAEGTPDNVKIMSVKALGSDGKGSSIDIWLGLEYSVINNVEVINMSLSGYVGGHISYIDDVIDSATDSGIIVCVAAGNDGVNTELYSPSNCESAITVGANGTNGDICYFSNRGELIDIFAPGQSIISADYLSSSSYIGYSGTSQATPHIAAVVALLKMLDDEINTDEVLELMSDSADDNGYTTAKCEYTYSGINYCQPILVLGSNTGKIIVTYNPNGGVVSKMSEEYRFMDNFSLPIPTREGYTFLGWYTASTGGELIENGASVELTHNITLYAQWRSNQLNGKIVSGNYTYFYKNGVIQKGWIFDSNVWYYADSYGVLQKGWKYIGNKWYFMNGNYVMTTGWQYVGGKWYYINRNGAMTTGWQYVGGKWYYMNSSGAMTTGWQYVGGRWYFMNSSGVWVK